MRLKRRIFLILEIVFMKIIKRILPILSITLIVLMISQLLYSELLEREEERCWRELKTSTQSIKNAMITKFSDEVIKLHLMEKIMLDNDIFDETNVDKLYIETVQPATIFSRIDVLYPDGTLISNGKILNADEDFDFYSITAKGEYISQRKTDFLTGEECVYYILPVMKNDQASAALNGKYIMDSWHKVLGNAYDTPDRKNLKVMKM